NCGRLRMLSFDVRDGGAVASGLETGGVNMRRKVGITVLIIIGLALIAGGGIWWLRSKGKDGLRFRTAPLKRGDMVATIGATGTVEPQEVVDIGTQVAGIIKTFGKD